MSLYVPGRVTLICELGHNHNGDFGRAQAMVEAAAEAGADAVKIQVRSIPGDLVDPDREKVVPWTGERMSYADYRRLCEFTPDQMRDLASLAHSLDMRFGASCWGVEAVDTFRDALAGVGGPDFYKLASASMTDHDLIEHMSRRAWEDGVPFLMSTGGCDGDMVYDAIDATVAGADVWLAQCTSTYPCPPEHVNLNALARFIEDYEHRQIRFGFSNHCVSIAPCIAAVALGAEWLEVHFTLDRSLPGTDQAASFEPGGVRKLREYVDTVSAALGDGVKRVMPGEAEIMRKLRRVS